MADIFVSYAKTDRALASKLIAMLEAEGWSVWWDKSLGAADLYRDEIMKQLAAARAVISIWTPNSIRSDWVRAEAGRAKADGKLIPVKTGDVAYGDIPLPFGEMHTENVGSTDLIRAAVVAQLAKPAVEPSAVALLTKGFRYEVLTWVGLIGGAVTLFTNLGAVLKLADWAQVLVQHWKEWTHAFWVWALGWLGIHLPPYWTPVLSFLTFGSLLTIGQAIKFNITIKQSVAGKFQDGRSFRLILWRSFVCVFVTFVVIGIWSITIPWMAPTMKQKLQIFPFVEAAVALGIPLVVMLVLFARHRLYAAVSVVLISIFFEIIGISPWIAVNPPPDARASLISLVAVMCIVPVTALSVAPAKAVSRRLIFLALGLLLLIALNELSKLGLDLTAPKHQG